MPGAQRSSAYRADLARVHDEGFTGPARRAAPAILRLLRRHRVELGRVVDLGCGTGVLAAILTRAGYDVLGIDQSGPMITRARRNAPKARFVRASFFDVALPPCDAVISVGECLSYLFDRRSTGAGIRSIFRRVHRALRPGGLFVFDLAAVSAEGRPAERIVHWEDVNWEIVAHIREQPRKRLLTRRIVTFVRRGGSWRRAEEVHHLRLYRVEEAVSWLESAGFEVEVLDGYGGARTPRRLAVFAARRRV